MTGPEDEYCTGDSYHQVPNDPLVLPSDSVMERRVFDEVAGKDWRCGQAGG